MSSPLERRDGEKLDFNFAAVAIGVADGGDGVADDGVDAELFGELAGEGFFGSLAGFNFAAGELPLEAHGLIGTALADEDFAFRAFTAEDEGGDDAADRFLRRRVASSVQFANRLVQN